MVRLFRAMGERNRLRMVLLLAGGPLNVSELVWILGISQSNASHHLKMLVDAGVLSRSGRGNWAFYQVRRDNPLTDAVVSRAFDSREMLQGFDQDMNRLARCLSRRKTESRRFFDSKEEEELIKLSDSLPDTSSCRPFMKEYLAGRELVADVGAGGGKMIPYLLSICGRVLAVDSSRKMLDMASKLVSSMKLLQRVEFRLGEAEHLPVKDRSVDGVFMHMVLHHCGDPLQAVSEAGRVLKPGGVLLVVDLPEHRNGSFREIHGDLWPGFTKERLGEAFGRAGLRTMKTEVDSNRTILAAAGVKGE